MGGWKAAPPTEWRFSSRRIPYRMESEQGSATGAARFHTKTDSRKTDSDSGVGYAVFLVHTQVAIAFVAVIEELFGRELGQVAKVFHKRGF